MGWMDKNGLSHFYPLGRNEGEGGKYAGGGKNDLGHLYPRGVRMGWRG